MGNCAGIDAVKEDDDEDEDKEEGTGDRQLSDVVDRDLLAKQVENSRTVPFTSFKSSSP